MKFYPHEKGGGGRKCFTFSHAEGGGGGHNNHFFGVVFTW